MEHALTQDSNSDFGFFAGLTGVRKAWFIHATVYLAVNLGVAALVVLHGRVPMLAMPLGWGVGLAVHGIVAALRGGRRSAS